MKLSDSFKRTVFYFAIILSALTTAPAHSDNWDPDGPIILEVGFSAGGSADTVARLIAQEIENAQGWKVVVDNKPGGGGTVMTGGLVRKPADGKTMGLAVSEALIYNLATRQETHYSLDDMSFLGTAGVPPISWVASPDAPFNDIQSFVEYAEKSGGATVAVPSKGTELLVRSIAKQSGAPIRPLPAQGGSAVLQQVMGNHVDAGFDGGAHVSYVKNGDLKVIAPATRERHPVASDILTFIEQGYDLGYEEPHFVFIAPKGISSDIRETLASALDEAIMSDAVLEMLEQRMSISVNNLGPEETEAMMARALQGAQELIDSVE